MEIFTHIRKGEKTILIRRYLLTVEGRKGEKIKPVYSPWVQTTFRWCDDKLRGWKADKFRSLHTIKCFGSPVYSSLHPNANRPGPAVSLTHQLEGWGLCRVVLQYPFLRSHPCHLPKSKGCHFGDILVVQRTMALTFSGVFFSIFKCSLLRALFIYESLNYYHIILK